MSINKYSHRAMPTRACAAARLVVALAASSWTTLSACSGNSGPGSEHMDDPVAGNAAVAGSGGMPGLSFGGRSSQAGEGAQAGTVNAGGNDCGATAFEAEPPKVNLLLVIDKSSSMENTSGFSRNKWSILREALESALQGTEDRLRYGLDFYPLANDASETPSTCETPTHGEPLVPIDAGTKAVPKILSALDEHVPAGGTPTAAALARAREYFGEGAGSELEGERYVLLATDGGPNCNADQVCEASACTMNMEGLNCGGNCCDSSKDPNGPLSCLDESGTVDQVKALAKLGVKTFVVGIPGSELYEETLNRVAEAGLAANEGGPTSYYRVNAQGDAEGLSAVLSRITTGVIKTCALQLASTPPDLGQLNVEIDGKFVDQQSEDGWSLDTTTRPPTINLKGETCRRTETQGAGSVTVSYGCPTFTVPR